MKLSTYLTALTLALAGTSDAMPKFKITFRPFANPECTDDLAKDHHPVNGPGVELAEGQCKSWNSERKFDSYTFKYAGEKRPKKNKTCDIILFGDEDCEKDSELGMLPKIEHGEKDGVCQNEASGFEGKGMSVQIRCYRHQ